LNEPVTCQIRGAAHAWNPDVYAALRHGDIKSEAKVASRGVSNYSAAKIALTAGGIGLSCGALVVGMMSGPSAIPSQVWQRPPAETKGNATLLSTEVPAVGKNEIASGQECDQQTWPYITQQCLTEREAARRKVRVITTDKIAPPVVSAIEQETMEPPRREHPGAQKHEPAPNTANLAAVENVRPAPPPAPRMTEAPKAPETKGTPAIVRLAPLAPSIVPVEQTPASESVAPLRLTPTPQIEAPRAATTAPPPKAAAKNIRNARNTCAPEVNLHRVPIRDSDNYDEVVYSPRSRVVERWTEREALVPPHESSERRRAIIIPRGSDGHPFGSVFGSSFR
jgi:hypothetical protein